MAFIIKDRVKEGTTSTGTGDITLSGSLATFDTFQSYMTNGDTTYYAIVHTSSGVDEWEVGLGTWNTGNTLTRTTVLSGSNGTSAENFSAGSKDVFMTYPAAHAALAGDDVDFANITVTGTVDGRDVATDGSKLDTVEQNADVTDAINVAAAGALMKSGGTMTGNLILNGDPTVALGAATKEYVDTIAAAGIHYHTPVRVEAPLNLTVTYNNGASGVGATLTNAGTQEAITIDGVALSSGDRVLVYEQTDATQNGIYTVTTVGSGSTNWVLTRATDADSYGASDPNALGEGDAYFVKEGATGAGELYVMNTAGTITFGTTDITFTVIAETAVYSAGTGLTLTGTTFAIGQDVGTTDDVTFNQVTAAIIGNVTGNVTGDLTGNAGTATKLATARTVQLSGDVTGSATFDGSANINITAAVQDDSHAHVISNVDGLQTALDAKVPTSRTITAGNGLTGGGDLTANRTLNVGAGTGIIVSADTVSIGQSVGLTDDVTFGKLTADVLIAEGGSFTSGTDTNTTSALVVNKGDQILVDDGVYLRNLIKQNTAGEIEIGQGGTSLITAINLRPGNTGTAEVNGVEIITTAGSGLSKSGDTLSHADTSSQASVDNSNGTVIQDITLDTYGHITSLASVNLDGRYYTESEIDTRMTYTLYAPQSLSSLDNLDSLSHLGWYKWGSSDPSNAPYDYGMLIHGTDGSQQQQLLQAYGGAANQVSLYGRRKTSGTWDTSWTQYFSDHYHPNADKWTTARTLSLSGDASGSVSWDGSANATLSVTVSNDSHSHSNYLVDTYLAGRSLSDANSADGDGITAYYLSAGASNSPAGTDHSLITLSYSGVWSTQEAADWRTNARYIRKQENGTWSSWQRLFADDYHPNADKWTTPRTLTLTGDVTGSVTWDGSGNASITTDWQGGQANTTLNMNNFSIINANNLTFGDPGPNEGITWNGGNGWHIYESPDDLTTNSGGNLQFVQSSTRRMTLKTNGDLDIVGGNLLVDINNGIVNSGGWTRNTTPYGYIEFGPANASWGHIYTDRPAFYFNKELYVNSNRVYNTAYHPEADKWTTARTLTLSGDASGSVSWDGSANATLSVSLDSDVHKFRGDITSQDWNTLIDGTETGYYTVVNGTGSNKAPSYMYGTVVNWAKAGQAKLQLYGPHNGSEGGNGLWFRTGWNTDYDPWAEIWHSNNDGSGSGLDADLLDGIESTGFQRQIDEVTVNLASPAASSGTWTNGDTDDWGTPRIGTSVARYNDGTGYIQFNVPAGMDTAYLSQLCWSSGGYADIYGVQSDGGLVFLRRINTRQTIENSNEGANAGNNNQHDGSTITLAASGLSYYSAIRIQNRSGRLHLTGLGFTSAKLHGAEGVGLVHPQQLSVQGSGSGLDADTLDGNHASAFALASHNHDDRYYTESEADSRFVNASGDTMTGDLTVDAGTSTTLSVKCDDAGLAMVRANGDSQGTGAVEVGQSNNYGGGISYNGDGSPAFVSGETADYITFYRLTAGTRTEVFSYPHNSSRVTFNEAPYVGGNSIFHEGYHPNADKLTTARNINGVAFDGTANITVADATKLPLSGGSLTGTVTAPAFVGDGSSLTNLDIATPLTALSTGTDATGSDLIPVYDVSAGTWEKQTITNAALQGPAGADGAAGAAGVNAAPTGGESVAYGVPESTDTTPETAGQIYIRNAADTGRITSGLWVYHSWTTPSYIRMAYSGTGESANLRKDSLIRLGQSNGQISYVYNQDNWATFNITGYTDYGTYIEFTVGAPFAYAGGYFSNVGAQLIWTSGGVNSWTSGDNTWAAGGTYTLSHSLGTMPKGVQVELVCIVANWGYSVGDVHVLSSGEKYANWGVALINVDSTTIKWGVYSNGIWFRRESFNSSGSMLNSQWRVRFTLIG